MTTLIQFLREFPASFAVIGLLVGGAVMFWVTKKFGPMRNDALAEVIEAYKQQVKAQIALSATQAEQHMVQLGMQKDHWSEELAKLEKERDTYRNTLHEVRNDTGALIETQKLRIQELELRPNIEVLQTEQQSFYRDMSDTLKGIATALKQHDDKIDERMATYFGPLQSACAGTAEAMTELVKQLTKKKGRAP